MKIISRPDGCNSGIHITNFKSRFDVIYYGKMNNENIYHIYINNEETFSIWVLSQPIKCERDVYDILVFGDLLEQCISALCKFNYAEGIEYVVFNCYY